MIKCEVRRNSAEVCVDADVEGPLSEIIDDVCRIVRAIHDEIQEGDPELAEAFRDCIQDLMDPMGAVWKGLEDREQLILAVVKEPGKEARMETIGNSLEALQAAVGGYIERVTVAEDLVLIVNEEGRLKGLPVNCRVLGHDLVGTVVAVGVKGEEFCSLSPSALEAAMELLGGCHGEAD